MPKKYTKREKDRQRLLRNSAAAGSAASPQGSRKKWWRKRRRLTDGLIGLGTAAVLTVYSVGYLHTKVAEGNGFVDVVASTPAPTSATNSGPLVVIGTPTPSPAPGQTGYKDGTYVGRGSSRHGDIQATVVIQGGQVTSASVTGCGTRYPCRDVNPLVSEVLKTQAAPVDHVSGATDSSKAYRDAVKAALAQAIS